MTRVHFVTLSRSDYASLAPVLRAAAKDPDFDVKLIAGGSHLLKRFGQTIDGIRAENFPKLEIVDYLHESDNSDAEMAAAYSRAVAEFVRVFTADPPQYVFIVGDRWEMLAVVTAAAMLRIPVAHHSGGDITQGSADNQTRYVLTTLSHLHFTALEEHAERLIRMGEEAWRVQVTGEPALTTIKDAAKSVPDIRSVLDLKPEEPFVLATFHPTSYDSKTLPEQIDIFTEALDLIGDTIILTAPNPDPGSAAFLKKLADYASRHPRVKLVESLGSANCYAAMAEAQFMIGNSSSGLWEAPSFGLPVVNIGSRQDGRTRGANVVDAPLDIKEIRKAIAKVSTPDFREKLKNQKNPYLQEDCIARILTVLKQKKSKEQILAKFFVDPRGQNA